MRLCDLCGSKLAPYQPRKRVGDHMLCPACAKDPINGTNVSVQRAPEIDTKGIPLDSGIASRHSKAKATKPKHILPHDGTLLPTSDEWRYGVDGIEGHDLPPGWVDDGVSPYPWVKHDPRDQMHRSLDEIRNVVQRGPHGGPLPVGVYENYYRRRALLGKAQVIPQKYVTPRRGMTKAAHKHEEHHGYGGSHWEHMSEAERRAHMLKWHGWPEDAYDDLNGDEESEHAHAHATGIADSSVAAMPHHHGNEALSHHSPPTANGIWNHLTSHYHGFDPAILGPMPTDESDRDTWAAMHDGAHNNANEAGTAHTHGADGLASHTPDYFLTKHGLPPDGFPSWEGFLHHMQKTHGWAQNHDISTADLGALEGLHGSEHADMDNSDEDPVHSHGNGKTQYHTPLVDPLDQANDEVKYHLHAYHGGGYEGIDPGSLLVHHAMLHGEDPDHGLVPHTHTSPLAQNQIDSLKTPYIPHPKMQKEHLISHLGIHHPEVDPDALLQAGDAINLPNSLANLHDAAHDDIDTDVAHTHAKPASPAEQTVMQAHANNAPYDYGDDALKHLVEHHGLVPGEYASTGGYSDTHKHLHEMWDNAAKAGQPKNFGMVIPHDHGKKWAAEAELAKQPPAPPDPDLQKTLLQQHLMSGAHGWTHNPSDDLSLLHSLHQDDHDLASDDNEDDKAHAHGPNDHLGLPEVHPNEPHNLPPSGSSIPNAPEAGSAHHNWLKKHMGDDGEGHEWSPNQINNKWTPEQLKHQHDIDHTDNATDEHHTHGSTWGVVNPGTADDEVAIHATPDGKYVNKSSGEPAAPTAPSVTTDKGTYQPEPVHQGKQWQVGREGEHYLTPVSIVPHATDQASAIAHLQQHHPEVTQQDYEDSPYKQSGWLKSWHDYLHGQANIDHPEWAPHDDHLHETQSGLVVPHLIPVGSHMVHDHGFSQSDIASMTPKEFHEAHERLHMAGNDKDIGHSHAYPGGPVIPPRTHWANPEYAHLGLDHPEAYDWFHGTSSHFTGPPLAGQDRKLQTGHWPQHDSCVDTYAMGHLTSLYQQAKNFGSRVMRLRLHMNNPKIYPSINHMNHDQYERLMATGQLHDPDYPNGGRVHVGSSKSDYQTSHTCCAPILHDFFRGAYNKGHDSGAELVRASMRADGHDGAMWRNHADSAGDGGRYGAWNAYPLSHHQIEVVHENASQSAANSGDSSRWNGPPAGWQGAKEPIEKRDDYPDREKIRLVHQAQDAGTEHTDFPVAPHPVDPKSHGTGFSSHPSGYGDPTGSNDYNEDAYCSKCGTEGHEDYDDHCDHCGEYGHDESQHDAYCPVCGEENDHGDNYENYHEYCDYCGEHTTHDSGDHEDEYGEHPSDHKMEDYCPHCGDVNKENRLGGECNKCGGALPDWSKVKTMGAPVPPWHKYLPTKRLMTDGVYSGNYEDIEPGEHTDEEKAEAKARWQHETGQMQVPGQGALFTPQVGAQTVPPKKGDAAFSKTDMADHLYHDHGSNADVFWHPEHTDEHYNSTDEGHDADAMEAHHHWLHLSGQAHEHGFPTVEHNHYDQIGPTVLGNGLDPQHLVAHMVQHHQMTADEAKKQLDDFGAEHLRQSHDVEHQVDEQKPFVSGNSYYTVGETRRLSHVHHEGAPDTADLGGSPDDLDTHMALEHTHLGVPKVFKDDPKMSAAWHNTAHASGHPTDYLNHAHLPDGTTRYTGKHSYKPGEYGSQWQAPLADIPSLIESKKHLLHQHGIDPIHLGHSQTLADLHTLHDTEHDPEATGILPHTHVHPGGWADFVTDPHNHLNMAHGVASDGLEEPSLTHAHDEDHKSGLADHIHALLPSTSDEKIHPMLMPSALGNAAGHTSILNTGSEGEHLKEMHGITATGNSAYLYKLHNAVHADPETNEVAGGKEIDHDHHPEGAVIDDDEKVPYASANPEAGATISDWGKFKNHMQAAHPHLLKDQGYMSSYTPSGDEAKKFHDLHEQAHAEGGDAHHEHEEDPNKPLLGPNALWANDALAKHMQSEHGWATSVLQGHGTHDNMAHHHLQSHAQGYADSGPHAHTHTDYSDFPKLHKDPTKPGQMAFAPVAGDKPSIHNHLYMHHQMSATTNGSAAELQAMHDAEHALTDDDEPDHKHYSVEGVNHYPASPDSDLIHHIHQAHGYNTTQAQHTTGEIDPEKQHAHLHWAGMGLPDHDWHDHPDVANPFPPHNPEQYQNHPAGLEEHLVHHHGLGDADLAGTSHDLLLANHDHMHSPEWMANNGLTQMPGHYHSPGGGIAKLKGPELPQPDHNPVALSNHLSQHHNKASANMTADEQSGLHDQLHNAPFLTHHTHAAPAPPSTDGQWQHQHLHAPQNFDELGHHMLSHHGWSEIDLPSSPHNAATPHHPDYPEHTVADWHTKDHEDGTDTDFKPLTHAHPANEPPMANWEHELMGTTPTPHPVPKGVQEISNHIGSWHNVVSDDKHYSDDTGTSGVGAHHHDLHLPGGGANHSHEGMGHFVTPAPHLGHEDYDDIVEHLGSHHGYTPDEVEQVMSSGSPYAEHEGAHELNLPGAQTHSHLGEQHEGSLSFEAFFEESLS